MNSWGKTVRVCSAEGEFSAYLSAPDAPKSVAVVVLQEIFGVNANIRAVCDTFANAGYAAIAPDLYWRQESDVQLDPGAEDGRARAVALMKGLDRDRSVDDAVAALTVLRDQAPGLSRSAAVGYCFGGGVSYLLAVRNLVDAGVAYYGTYLHTLLGEASGLQGRLLLHIAENDHLCPPEARAAIAQALDRLSGKAEVVIHEGVGHAFAREGGSTYNQEAAGRANKLTMNLLSALASQP